MRPEAALQVHTLLRLRRPEDLVWEASQPEWAVAALTLAPWVVVRRQASPAGLLAVGVRGSLRLQRSAAWLPQNAVQAGVTPQALVADRVWQLLPGAGATPAIAALDAVEAIVHAHGWDGHWGPGGSVGFELASTCPCTTVSSDLDLVLWAQAPVAVAAARALQAELSQLPARCDALLETPYGAVSLAEYARSSGPMLLRTPQGPRLVADPWQDAPAAARVA